MNKMYSGSASEDRKVSSTIKNEFDSKLVYNQKYLKTKKKVFNGKISANFHNIKTPKEVSECICQSVILIDSIYRKDKDYYCQLFLEECKCVVK